MKNKRIVIFASGNGTNAQNIIEYFQQSQTAKVVSVFSNNLKANVLNRSEQLGVKTISFTKEELSSKNGVVSYLLKEQPDLIVLAGFLLKFPSVILENFPKRVINIHPALLPKYGGKGMYGNYVHEAVFKNNETETGITIHYVNENYDEGAIIFQKSIPVLQTDTPDKIARKVHLLEQQYFPEIIQGLIAKE